MRSEILLGRTSSNGKSTEREVLEEAARLGSAAAKAELAKALECPEETRHLVTWAYSLYGRSGATMDGKVLPLSYSELGQWERLNGYALTPWEVLVLVALDEAIRNPEHKEE